MMFVKKKKDIRIFSAARFIISERLMARNYSDIITYAFFFVKSRSLQLRPKWAHPTLVLSSQSSKIKGQERSAKTSKFWH
jgi:hypothetical protein